MPILRYFVVVGLLLLGGLFAADHFVPSRTAASGVASEADDALTNWRAAEARKSVHARSAETNQFTQSYAMFAPSPAFGLNAHDIAALDARAALQAPAAQLSVSDTRTETKTAAVRPAVQDAPRKPRRHQIAQAPAAASRSLALPAPSADSLRQDAMNREMARAAFAQQRGGLAFGQPQWPQAQPQFGGFREANARAQGQFGPRTW